MTLSSRISGKQLSLPLNRDLLNVPSNQQPHEFHPPIDLSISQNLLSLPFVTKALNELPAPPQALLFPPTASPHFLSSLRDQLVNLFSTKIAHFPVQPNSFSIFAGLSSALDALGFALCDKNDAAIVTGPGYSGTSRSVLPFSSVHCILAEKQEPDFVFTIDSLDVAMKKASPRRVRVLFIVSPDNPTGQILSRRTIRNILDWASANELHVVFDEVYALSVHDASTTFTSVIDVLEGNLPANVHVMWSVSKDLCLSGLHCGFLYSHNEELVHSLSILSRASRVSLVSQWTVSQLLSQEQWFVQYLQENSIRLRTAFEETIDFLKKAHIPYWDAKAGFFVWIDLRKWLTELTPKGEMLFRQRLSQGGILLTPGSYCQASSVGFFRICYAAADLQTRLVAFQRLQNILDENMPHEAQN